MIRILGFVMVAYVIISVITMVGRMMFPDKFHDRKKRK
jgi:hypothetical protein